MERVLWTDEEDKALIGAVASGLAARHIDIPGRSLHSIQTRLHRLDIRPSSLTGKEKGYALRKCLSCQQTFGSEHIGNRICLPCKRTVDHLAA
ncbi:hypothetical protein HFO84_00090 [Rhizobium leguminosarum]|uniref:hypothetical protein n=1 Tax=Rhizobium leguminosarum TaxID=384 RepID=UPI001C9763E3|nr:hypothetical protein [Rhizobium leguminosarum]MBY5475730.1 hypothetical protein [Rhizobium leguminosarum]